MAIAKPRYPPAAHYRAGSDAVARAAPLSRRLAATPPVSCGRVRVPADTVATVAGHPAPATRSTGSHSGRSSRRALATSTRGSDGVSSSRRRCSARSSKRSKSVGSIPDKRSLSGQSICVHISVSCRPLAPGQQVAQRRQVFDLRHGIGGRRGGAVRAGFGSQRQGRKGNCRCQRQCTPVTPRGRLRPDARAFAGTESNAHAPDPCQVPAAIADIALMASTQQLHSFGFSTAPGSRWASFCGRERLLVWCVTNTFNYFRVFRRHAALLVGAIEELCLLLAPCLTTKSIGNIVQLIYDTPH